jgi:hypothetical protein
LKVFIDPFVDGLEPLPVTPKFLIELIPEGEIIEELPSKSRLRELWSLVFVEGLSPEG